MTSFQRYIIRLMVRSMLKINGYLRSFITSRHITRSVFIGISYNIELLLNEIVEEINNITLTDIKVLKKRK
jgi:hypothetical protein